MQTQRIVLSLAVAVAGIGAVTSASSQEYRGTWEQQMACTPDVWRLCSDQVPDVGRIVTCLRQNTPQLSSNCRAVFEFERRTAAGQSHAGAARAAADGATRPRAATNAAAGGAAPAKTVL